MCDVGIVSEKGLDGEMYGLSLTYLLHGIYFNQAEPDMIFRMGLAEGPDFSSFGLNYSYSMPLFGFLLWK